MKNILFSHGIYVKIEYHFTMLKKIPLFCIKPPQQAKIEIARQAERIETLDANTANQRSKICGRNGKNLNFSEK